MGTNAEGRIPARRGLFSENENVGKSSYSVMQKNSYQSLLEILWELTLLQQMLAALADQRENPCES